MVFFCTDFNLVVSGLKRNAHPGHVVKMLLYTKSHIEKDVSKIKLTTLVAYMQNMTP